MSDTMTPAQAARCDALAKRIAELDPDWPKPGMAADMNGYSLRFVGCVGHPYMGAADGWVGNPAAAQLRRRRGKPADTSTPLFDRPTVCVPDWRDPATLGAILLSLGAGGVAVARMVAVPLWRAVVEPGFSAPAADTRVGAILAAKVAQLEGKDAKLAQLEADRAK